MSSELKSDVRHLARAVPSGDLTE